MDFVLETKGFVDVFRLSPAFDVLLTPSKRGRSLALPKRPPDSVSPPTLKIADNPKNTSKSQTSKKTPKAKSLGKQGPPNNGAV